MAASTKEMVQKTLQANKDHQYALKVYTERLEAELATVDRLLTSADLDEQEDEDLDVGGFVLIPGSVKPTGPISVSDLLSQDSPFHGDAVRRQRYLNLTVTHPMKAKELDALTEAVRTENYRIHAYEAHRRGQQALSSLNERPQSYFELNREGIDWDRVASKVSESNSSYVQRTAKECEIRWLGDRHPQFNHSIWSQTETAQLKAVVANYREGHVDWVKVAEQLGTNRTPIDCMRNAIPRRSHIWTSESDNRLLEAVKMYGTENWTLVATVVSEDATVQQCQNRYNRTLDPNLTRGPWNEEEDERLRLAVSVHGHAWLEVASSIPGRNNEQCRDRWNERLNPSVSRAKWTEEEDLALEEIVGRLGESKWKDISEAVGNGRTDKMCRARYGQLKKQKQKEDSAPAESSTRSDQSQTPDISAVPSEAASSSRPPPRPRTKKADKITTTNAEAGPSIAGEEIVPPIMQQKPRPKPRAKNKGKQPQAEHHSSTNAPQEGADSDLPAEPTKEGQPIIKVTLKLPKRIAQDTGDEPPKKKRRTKKSRAEPQTDNPEDSVIDPALREDVSGPTAGNEPSNCTGDPPTKGKGKRRPSAKARIRASNPVAEENRSEPADEAQEQQASMTTAPPAQSSGVEADATPQSVRSSPRKKKTDALALTSQQGPVGTGIQEQHDGTDIAKPKRKARQPKSKVTPYEGTRKQPTRTASRKSSTNIQKEVDSAASNDRALSVLSSLPSLTDDET